MKIACMGVVGVLLLGLAPAAWSASGGFNREYRYPTRFEVRPGPNGVAIVPSEFTTRTTGPSIKIAQVGLARNVIVDGVAGVQLRMQDGRTLVTRTGRLIKLDGVVYRTQGWKDGKYLLVSQGGDKRTIAFGLPQ